VRWTAGLALLFFFAAPAWRPDFRNVASGAGLSAPFPNGGERTKRYILETTGSGAAFLDYDNDGWPDLYVADDAGPNYLYRNKHDGTFEEVGLMLGADLSGDGQELGSMGVDFGDYDHDGKLDIFVTEFVDQSDTLYHNKGKDGFEDVSWSSHIAQPSHPYVGWAVRC